MLFQKKGLRGTCRRGGGHPGIDARERLTMALKKFHCPTAFPSPARGKRRSAGRAVEPLHISLQRARAHSTTIRADTSGPLRVAGHVVVLSIRPIDPNRLITGEDST